MRYFHVKILATGHIIDEYSRPLFKLNKLKLLQELIQKISSKDKNRKRLQWVLVFNF